MVVTVGPYRLIRHPSWSDLAAQFAPSAASHLAGATPFQSGSWLQAWYDTLGQRAGVTPLPLEIQHAVSGEAIFALPLVVEPEAGLQVVKFADATLTDYNAPLLGRGFLPSADAIAPDDLLRVLRAGLAEFDVLRFNKMPKRLAEQVNPLALLPGHCDSMFGSNVVYIEEDWSLYRKRLAKKIRKELERSFRVFQRDGSNARFRVITDKAEASSILHRMEEQQIVRMEDLGLPYVLNEPAYRRFFRRLVELDLENGQLLLSVLESEPDELVAALLGLVQGKRYAMVRLTHAGRAWSHCSPGKIMIDQTMEYLHKNGVTQFDFTTGDYSYKRAFLPVTDQLSEVALGLSLRGRVHVGTQRMVTQAKDRVREYPRLYGALKALRSAS